MVAGTIFNLFQSSTPTLTLGHMLCHLDDWNLRCWKVQFHSRSRSLVFRMFLDVTRVDTHHHRLPDVLDYRSAQTWIHYSASPSALSHASCCRCIGPVRTNPRAKISLRFSRTTLQESRPMKIISSSRFSLLPKRLPNHSGTTYHPYLVAFTCCTKRMVDEQSRAWSVNSVIRWAEMQCFASLLWPAVC